MGKTDIASCPSSSVADSHTYPGASGRADHDADTNALPVARPSRHRNPHTRPGTGSTRLDACT